MRNTIVSLAAASLLLAACSSKEGAVDSTATMTPGMGMDSGAGAMAPGTAAGSTASLTDANTGAQLDSVATAARTGLTALPAAVAVPLIRSLEDKLDNSNDPALTDIAKDLEKLREELEDSSINTGDVASILERLGPKVTAVASKGGAASASLTSIGQSLSSAAVTLKAAKK